MEDVVDVVVYALASITEKQHQKIDQLIAHNHQTTFSYQFQLHDYQFRLQIMFERRLLSMQ
jgi:uncharacterized protein YqiB (DUF1249 family)